MRLWDSQGPHERGNIVGENLGGIGAVRFVGFASPSEVEGDAGVMLGIFCHLKGITGVIGGQVRNENQGLAGPLLVIVHSEVVRFDLGHGNPSFRTALVIKDHYFTLTARPSPARGGPCLEHDARISHPQFGKFLSSF